MGYLGKKWSELVYTLTSNDRYAGYHSSKAVKSLATESDESDDSDAEEMKEAAKGGSGGIATAGVATISTINGGYSDKLDESGYSADEKQQAQLVLDAWHIIEDVINLDMKDAGDGSNTHFTLNPKNYDFDYEDEIDNIDDIPDAEDFLNSLSSPCTVKDLQVAQKHLGVRLPYPVVQYFLVHDGQEVPPSSTRKIGIMYGLQLLSLAEVVTMTNYWRKVSRKESNARFAAQDSSAKEERLQQQALYEKEDKLIENDPNFKIVKKIDRISKNDLQNYPDLVRNMSTHSKNDYIKKLPEQKSYPPNKVRLQYANPNWIPLVTDNTGNHIAIDLDPDTQGVLGQVIIFGREYDTKYVIADNWGQFMNKFALDFEDAGRCNLDYDSEMGQFDLAYLDKKGDIVDEGYLYVLAQRALGKDI